MNDFSRLGAQGGPAAPRPSGLPGPLGRIAGIVIGAVLAISALFVSVIAFAVVVVVAVIAGGWLWWRTRDLRKQLRSEMDRMREAAARGEPLTRGGPFGPAGDRPPAPAERGEVIEGDFIREAPRNGQAPRE